MPIYFQIGHLTEHTFTTSSYELIADSSLITASTPSILFSCNFIIFKLFIKKVEKQPLTKIQIIIRSFE